MTCQDSRYRRTCAGGGVCTSASQRGDISPRRCSAASDGIAVPERCGPGRAESPPLAALGAVRRRGDEGHASRVDSAWRSGETPGNDLSAGGSDGRACTWSGVRAGRANYEDAFHRVRSLMAWRPRPSTAEISAAGSGGVVTRIELHGAAGGEPEEEGFGSPRAEWRPGRRPLPAFTRCSLRLYCPFIAPAGLGLGLLASRLFTSRCSVFAALLISR